VQVPGRDPHQSRLESSRGRYGRGAPRRHPDGHALCRTNRTCSERRLSTSTEIRMNSNPRIVLSFLSLAAVACTVSGVGTGELTQAGIKTEPVSLQWHSNSDNGGTMTALLGDGDVFEGKYLQVTRQIADGWDNSASARPYGEGTAAEESTTEYTRRVVATLTDKSGAVLRCRFILSQPASGMAGGGSGQCRSSGGAVLDATFPRR
jgi:hypothetical protein